MANAASVTRQIKKIVDDPETAVTTRHCRDSQGDDFVWQSFVFVEQHKHDALVSRFAEAGLTRVSRSADFLSVIQPAD